MEVEPVGVDVMMMAVVEEDLIASLMMD